MVEPRKDDDGGDVADAPSPSPQAVPPGFEVVRILGEGGFGRVLLARTRKGVEIALKRASPKTRGAVAALAREREALAKVGEGCAPGFIDAGILDDGTHWLAMDVVPGVPWPGPLPAGASELPVDLGLRRFQAFLHTLERVHAVELVHCDLKPENIFVRPDETITLIDFGLARAPSSEPTSEDDVVVGTAHYMSPEQCRPGVTVDLRSDIYAAGVLLYTALSGGLPFEGSAEEIREAHRSLRPPSLIALGVPPEIDEVLMRCLAKDPRARPATAQELAATLLAATEEVGTFAVSRSPAKRTSGATEQVQSRGKREMVGVLRFESPGSAVTLSSLAKEAGGQLVHAKAGKYILACTNATTDNPVYAALATGNTVVGRGLTERVLVDVAEATVTRKPDGSERIVSRAWRGDGFFLPADAPCGLFATTAAIEHLPNFETRPVPQHAEIWQLGTSEARLDVTETTRFETPHFGRNREVARLQHQAAKTADGVPGLATVVGDRGFGKTRLAQDLVERVRSAATRLIAFRVADPSYGSRESTARKLLTSIVRLPSEAPEDLRALLRHLLGAVLPDDELLGLRLAMGWIAADDPDIRRLRAAPGAIRSMLAKALGEVLIHCARSQPLRVIIDDAQFLDDAVLDALEYATRSEVRAPLWICVLTRPGFDKARAAWGAHAGMHERVHLPALPMHDASRLIRHLLHQATNVSEAVVQRLVDRTRGVPLVMVELIRALTRDGFVRQRDTGRGWIVDADALQSASDVPLVQWLLSRELDTLSAALRAHAGLVAVLGSGFRIDQLTQMVRRLETAGEPVPSELDPVVGVHRLRRAGILVEDAQRRFDFRHEALREHAYSGIELETRKAAHRAAYQAVEADPHLKEDERLSQLAFHASGAEQWERAIEHQLALARRAVDRHDYLVANEAFQRALVYLPPEDPRRLQAVHGLALMRFRMGRHEDALRGLDQAAELARALSNRSAEFDILLDMATVLDWAEDYPTSARRVQQAEALVDETTDPLARARLLLGRGRSLFRMDDAATASHMLAEAAEVARDLGEGAYETWVIAMVLAAPLAALTGNEAKGRTMFDELLALCQSHGDQLHLATTYLNRCVVWLASAEVEALMADMRQAIAITRSAGFPNIEVRALFNLGEVNYMVARYEDAKAHAQQAIELNLALFGGVGQSMVTNRLLLARSYLLAGEEDKAAAELEIIRQAQADRRAQGAVDTEFVPSDQSLFRMVELALAKAEDTEWDALIRDTAAASVQQELVEVMEVAGWIAARAGRSARAEEVLERAVAESMRSGTLLRGRVAQRLRGLRSADRRAVG